MFSESARLYDPIYRPFKEGAVRQGTATIALDELPYTARAKKIIELSMRAARDLNHDYVGTEHLLLGMIMEENGIAAQVLTSMGVTREQALAETIELTGANVDPAHLTFGPPLTLLEWVRSLWRGPAK